MAEEVIAVNDQTGERVAFRNGAWVSIGGGTGAQPQTAAQPQATPQQPQQRPSVDRGTRNNNRGNLKASGWTRNQPGFVGVDKDGFAIFDSAESGDNAQVNLLRTNYAGRTPTEVVAKYAPVGPENSQESVNNYVNYISRRVGVDPNYPLSAEQMAVVAEAMREFETGNTVAFDSGIADGTRAVNDETGEVLVFTNGEWVPEGGEPNLAGAEGFDADGIQIANAPGLHTDTQSRWGTRENPWELGALAEEVNQRGDDQSRQALAGNWIRTPDGVTQLRSVEAGKRNGEQIDGTNVYLNETGAAQDLGAAVMAANEQIPFSNDILAATRAATTGQSWGDARQEIRDLKNVDRETDQGARNIGGVAGFGSQLLVPGAVLGRANSAIKAGNAGFVARNVQRLGALSGVGAAGGFVQGVGTSDGSALERLRNGGTGAAVGAVAAPVAPAAASVVGKALDPLVQLSGRGINSASGGRLLQQFAPDARAERRIVDSLLSEGVNQQQIDEAVARFANNGVTPSAIDIIQAVAPGGKTARLIRGAALEAGPAAVTAERYLQDVSGNLQDRAIGLTRELTPGNNITADELIDSLKARRSASASTDYAEPYAQRLTPTQEVVDSLAGDPGLAAIRRARSSADARQDYNAVAELDALGAAVRSGGPIPEVSGGVLDMVQRAMGGRARKAEMAPDTRDIAAGLYGRQSSINDFLDSVPGLQQARDTYRGFTEQIEGVDLGRAGLNATPDQFNPSYVQQPAAAVGYRSALEAAIGRPAEGATGVLNRISTATNQRRNLSSVFGDEAAERYQGGVGNLIDQINNARFLASSSGSQSTPRAIDALVTAGSVGADVAGGAGIGTVTRIVEKLSRGTTLTKAEREALVRIGTTEADLQQVIRRGGDITQLLGAPGGLGAASLATQGQQTGPQ